MHKQAADKLQKIFILDMLHGVRVDLILLIRIFSRDTVKPR